MLQTPSVVLVAGQRRGGPLEKLVLLVDGFYCGGYVACVDEDDAGEKALSEG